jgi:hypothetical protein
MNTNEHAHAPRPKFDTLFADARHYRGDCRLVVTAIQRGWLKDAPQADRDALAARFEQVTTERWAQDPDTRSVRAFFAECAVLLAMDRDDTAPIHRALRYAWAGELTDRTTGRPRERWYVTDYPNRLDAAAIQRDAKRDGRNPLDVRGLTVTRRDDEGERTDTVEVVAMPDRFRRVKLWLVCPRCKCRRAHLYPVRAGVRCRKCAGIAYADGE